MSDPYYRPLNTGDTADDDAVVLDSLVQQASTPPAPIPEPIPPVTLPEPVPPTQLITVRQYLDPAWVSPTQILPADLKRTHLTLKVTGTGDPVAATDGLTIRSDIGPQNSQAILFHGQTLELNEHTGAIYAQALFDNAVPVYIDVWSVTQ